MEVDIERAETEVKKYVKSQNAGSAALTAIKTAKNKPDEPKKIDVEFTFNRV